MLKSAAICLFAMEGTNQVNVIGQMGINGSSVLCLNYAALGLRPTTSTEEEGEFNELPLLIQYYSGSSQ